MNTKSILYNLFAVSMLLAGALLPAGCTDTMQINEEGDRNNTTGTAAGKLILRFGDGTRAGEDAAGSEGSTVTTEDAVDPEKKINKLYLALFQNGSLYSMYKYPGGETSETSGFSTTISGVTNSDGIVTSYEVEKPGYTGSYEAYVIANPSAAVETALEAMKGSSNTPDTESVAKKDDFLKLYMTGSEDRVPTNDDEKAYAEKKEGETRGFTMVSEPTAIDLRQSGTSANITLTRIAARFDFVIWSADGTEDVTVKSITLNNAAQRSTLFPDSEGTSKSENWFASQQYANPTFTPWEDGPSNTKKATFYTYENLNVEGGTNMQYPTIKLNYTLGEEPKERELTIHLKDKNGNSLPVTRNHLYRIYLNSVTAEFTIQVLDWNASSDYVQIHNEAMAINYTENDLGKTGDYVYSDSEGNLYFSDGGLRTLYIDGSMKWSWDGYYPLETKNVDGYTLIGIVTSDNMSAADTEAGFDGGYIFTNKYNGGQWRKEQVSSISAYTWGLYDIYNQANLLKDIDGRSHTELMLANEEELKVNTLFANLKKFRSENKLHNTDEDGTPLVSEWFMPTMAQHLIFFQNIDRTSVKNRSYDKNLNYYLIGFGQGGIKGDKTSGRFRHYLNKLNMGLFNGGWGSCSLSNCGEGFNNQLAYIRFVSNEFGSYRLDGKHIHDTNSVGSPLYLAFSKKAVKPIPAN